MIQTVIRAIINESIKSPLDYPLKEAPKIFAMRLAIFLAVVLANFILFGLVLAIVSTPIASLPVPALCAIISFSILIFSLIFFNIKVLFQIKKQQRILLEQEMQIKMLNDKLRLLKKFPNIKEFLEY